MSEVACARQGCAIPGRHRVDHPEGEECRGCLPALAQDGLRLCPLHTTRISLDALRCAELDYELELALAGTGVGGERTSGGTAEHGTAINERAMEVRAEIRHTLVAWTRLVAEKRGIHLPPDNLDAIAAYLATHHVWLAAHPAAAECSDELSTLQRRAFNAAYPSGARVFPVGPCPAPACDSTIRVVLRAVDSAIPSELVCEGAHNEDCECGNCPPHRWPYSQTNWRRLGNKINQRYLSPAEIAEQWNMPIGSVYRRASEAKWRRSQDGRRPALYLAEDVRATLDNLTRTEA